MKRLLVIIPVVLFALPAAAQTAPTEAYRDLWCGIAFGTAAQGAPYTDEDLAAAKAAATPTDEQKQILDQQTMVDQFVTGGQTLIEQATTAYKGAGFTDDTFAKARADLEPKVAEQIGGAGAQAEFTFEECSALLPAAATAPADGTTPTTTTEAPAAAMTTTTETPATTTTTTSAP